MRKKVFKKISVINIEMVKEKPPNKTKQKNIYRTIKCPLKTVLKNYKILHPIIEKNVNDINQFVIIGYQFIRLYLLHKFNNGEKLPIVNKQFILDVLKTIGNTKTKAGKQKTDSKIKNKQLKKDLIDFNNNTFKKLVNTNLSYTGKTFILEQTANEMIRCIETNISTNFIKYLAKYINCLFKKPKELEIKKEKDKVKRKKLYKDLNKEIRDLKSDLITNKIESSDKKYHKWIKDNKQFLFPTKITKTVAYDVKAHTNEYIACAYYINKQIELLNARPYQVIPQRNNIVPKNITLNTCAIVDMVDKNNNIFDYKKSELVLHGKKHQMHIWSKILKLEKRSIFNNDDYVFYNQIMTDGFSCSLLFIRKEFKDKKFGDKLPKIKDDDDNFRKLEDLTKDECKKFLSTKYKILGIDPGKRKIVSIIDGKNKFYQYSACRRRCDNYTKRCNYVINKEKKKNNIIKKETEQSKLNTRTLNEKEYKKFIIGKMKLNNETKKFYNRILFRKLSFRRFVRTKQSETTIINEIENKFLTKKDKEQNKKIVLFYGDYSRTTQMKYTIPCPNIGFKKLLAKKFEIINVNEFNTSKLYNKTFEELKNINIRKGKHNRHIHEILTPKEESKCRIFVNRDKNASKNILYLAKYYLENQSRPKEFRRKEIRNKKETTCCLIK